MSRVARARILCVDDERNIIEGLSRTLRQHFDVVTAMGPGPAVDLLRTDRQFAVVVSDYRMPGVNGVMLLKHVRDCAPDAVRVLLTGQADLKAAADAVNTGGVFRLLLKPCGPEILVPALTAAVRQHQLQQAEREVLEQTVRGSVKALIDVLALANPMAFGRATRVKQHIGDLGAHIGLGQRWEMEVAALLSQIGCVTLPPAVVEKLYHGHPLEPSERAVIDGLGATAADLIADIPRLDGVREILRHFQAPFHGTANTLDGCPDGFPIGARLLRVALDFEELLATGLSPAAAIDQMRMRRDTYDPAVLGDFAQLQGARGPCSYREVALRDLTPGMVFAEDLRTHDGRLLVAHGHEVTAALFERIHDYWVDLPVVEPVRIVVRHEAPATAADDRHTGEEATVSSASAAED